MSSVQSMGKIDKIWRKSKLIKNNEKSSLLSTEKKTEKQWFIYGKPCHVPANRMNEIQLILSKLNQFNILTNWKGPNWLIRIR